MNRRRLLGALAAGGSSSIAGCLGSSDDEAKFQGAHTADPTTASFSYDCEQAEIFEDSVSLEGRATSVFLGNSAAEWQIDIEAGRDLQIAVHFDERASKASSPNVELIGPNDTVLLDESDSSSIYAISTESDGRYTLRLRNREWTSRERLSVEISWYNGTGCTRFTGSE